VVLGENWGSEIRTFVRETAPGFKSEPRCPKQDLEYNSKPGSDDKDEFYVGEF
jgi:hypothetical protein